MLVDIEVSLRVQFQVECPMLGEQFEHVVQEANARGDVIAACAFNPEEAGDLSFFGIALEAGFSHSD
jgi:hypothetical protein